MSSQSSKVWYFPTQGIYLTLLCLAVVNLLWLIAEGSNPPEPGVVGNLRNSGFPETFISVIHVDLTSPNHYVTLEWTGPQAHRQETGPFRSSPGRGWGDNDCNDVVESNCPGSKCTPKGRRKVEGFKPHLGRFVHCRYATVIDKARAISLHGHPAVPNYPASEGCIRLEPRTAKLIYDNAIVEKTEVIVGGEWSLRTEN